MKIVSPDTHKHKSIGIRAKLIGIFVLIKVVPLVLLSWYLWSQMEHLGSFVKNGISQLSTELTATISEIGDKATDDAVDALDERSREAIERLTTDTAIKVANFLYERDRDILKASELPLNQQTFKSFIDNRTRALTHHSEWVLNEAKTEWIAKTLSSDTLGPTIQAELPDNKNAFHYRPPINKGISVATPLYREITLLDLNGQELIKVVSDLSQDSSLKDISDPKNTYIGSERYFESLKMLKPGEIFVSDVIGAYVPSPVIGKYIPAAAEKRGIAFEPEKSAYAGKENPLGKRFEGIVRWATPIHKDGQVTGYITLALNHSHIMEFTDHIVPTSERYTDISDASTGNYAFMWDYAGRNISHPRDYFIVGYDPETGEQAMPWLENELYQNWKNSGLNVQAYLDQTPIFQEQSLQKKPAIELIKQGLIGLDCRYLNFAPQCHGWMNLTQNGGSGSFKNFLSGIWKLNTAATIPYFTGQYANSPRGFGFVTIGANVHEFHAAAIESRARLETIIDAQQEAAIEHKDKLENEIGSTLSKALVDLSSSTILLTIVVIGIAIWMASYLSNQITGLIAGIYKFQQGKLSHRLPINRDDEIGELAESINAMAANLQTAFDELNEKNQLNQSLMTDMRSEIEERKKVQKTLNHLAYYDELTALPNRFHLMERLEKELALCARNNESIAVLFLDLDGFKYINDTLGHHLGDQLLIQVASRLHSNSREGDFIARLGGDEFTIVIKNAPNDTALSRLSEHLIELLSQKFVIFNNDVFINASIGIAKYPEQASNINDLLQNADTAMYFAKDQGKGCYRFWNQNLKSQSEARLKMASCLRTAISDGEFHIQYQPKVDATSLKLVGFEALLRWHSTTLGMIPPDQFIPVAEETGIITEIGRWVIEDVCRQIKQWSDEELRLVPISINVSAKQIGDTECDLPSLISETAEHFGISPELLDVELTETHMMEQPEQAISVLQALKEIKVTASIDDFGTGYSSLSYLRKFPVNTLKIDKSFVRDLEFDKADVELARSIIEMGHSIGLNVVAEGVETKVQMSLLQEMGCDHLQGYLFSKPKRAEELAQWFTQHEIEHSE